MKELKRNPLRSRARRAVLRAIGDNDIVNKLEIAKITSLSPLTINSILREFRNYKLVQCHIGGLYSLSGEGEEWYRELIVDKKFRKREYEERMKKQKESEDEVKVKRTIIIEDTHSKKKSEELEEEEKKAIKK